MVVTAVVVGVVVVAVVVVIGVTGSYHSRPDSRHGKSPAEHGVHVLDAVAPVAAE